MITQLAKQTFARTMSTATSTQSLPKVLRIGPIKYAHRAWDDVQQTQRAEVLDLPIGPNYGRAEFINDLQNNPQYQDIQVISRDLETKRYVGLFDEELVSFFPQSVKAVVHRAAGYDQVDVEALSKRKIQLSNTPDLVSNATADTHVFLLISALRNFQLSHDNLMAGQWPKVGGSLGAGTPEGHDPEGKTVGILGNGKIGRAIMHRLKPFGFSKFIYHNRRQLSPELEAGATYVQFDELLAQSDIISINLPLNSSTKHIINAEAIAKMKDGVVIINTARGAVIDELLLIEALKNGKVFAAGMDVFENEPFGVNQELINLPNVVSLPHMGTHTIETIKKMEEFVVQNILTFIDTGKVKTIVPEQQSVEF